MYQVGDILYIISNKRRQIVPVQVCEQVTRRTLDGEHTSYKVKLPESGKEVELDSITGDQYSSLGAARKVLEDQFRAALDGLVEQAVTIASGFSPPPAPPVELEVETAPPEPEPKPEPKPKRKRRRKKTNPPVAEEPTPERVQVELPDGTRANVIMPSV